MKKQNKWDRLSIDSRIILGDIINDIIRDEVVGTNHNETLIPDDIIGIQMIGYIVEEYIVFNNDIKCENKCEIKQFLKSKRWTKMRVKIREDIIKELIECVNN